MSEYEHEQVLEEIATYAWDRKKFVDGRFKLGEGLAGQAWVEGEYIYLTEVPNDYVYIKSGIGSSLPRNIIVVPLKYNDVIYGVIELASFNKFTDAEKSLILKVSENIASTLSNTLNAQKMKTLLNDSQTKEVMLREQEEEMRQNLEELEATQEDMRNKEKSTQIKLKALEEENMILKQRINELMG